MSLFRKHEVVIFKDNNHSRDEVDKLKQLCDNVDDDLKKKIEKQIYILEKGLKGEEEVLFQLKYSGMDMFVLRDVFLKDGDLSAQIDFFVITPKLNFIIECKNLFGNITINNRGDFIRSYNYGSKSIKTGIESPITQNERHLQVLKSIQVNDSSAIFRNMVEKKFYDFNKSLVVLANKKTILNDRFAPKEIKEKVIRADQLVATIKKICDESKELSSSVKEMRTFAEWVLSHCDKTQSSYFERYQLMAEKQQKDSASDTVNKKDIDLCPKCNSKLLLRNGKFGAFWGCSSYPECRYTKKISDEHS